MNDTQQWSQWADYSELSQPETGAVVLIREPDPPPPAPHQEACDTALAFLVYQAQAPLGTVAYRDAVVGQGSALLRTYDHPAAIRCQACGAVEGTGQWNPVLMPPPEFARCIRCRIRDWPAGRPALEGKVIPPPQPGKHRQDKLGRWHAKDGRFLPS